MKNEHIKAPKLAMTLPKGVILWDDQHCVRGVMAAKGLVPVEQTLKATQGLAYVALSGTTHYGMLEIEKTMKGKIWYRIYSIPRKTMPAGDAANVFAELAEARGRAKSLTANIGVITPRDN